MLHSISHRSSSACLPAVGPFATHDWAPGLCFVAMAGMCILLRLFVCSFLPATCTRRSLAAGSRRVPALLLPAARQIPHPRTACWSAQFVVPQGHLATGCSKPSHCTSLMEPPPSPSNNVLSSRTGIGTAFAIAAHLRQRARALPQRQLLVGVPQQHRQLQPGDLPREALLRRPAPLSCLSFTGVQELPAVELRCLRVHDLVARPRRGDASAAWRDRHGQRERLCARSKLP